ncbi:FMN-linked oxidoreductase [Gymnopus androsaceus JB14]|uniref:FMN-linked oxidoreductase n=1 Tax=Gymnopus androsaceus JB14 TaxID=1447944 RepID=A0A6A4I2Z0_9AGAR|nr:FMN-linked oxidoreductase [Gymnopus androsaceus JB14]
MAQIGSIVISPPLINTACAWASDLDQLQALYESPFTGAVTTRTSTLTGYNETAVCGVVFTNSTTSSLNSYGFSPLPLSSYLGWVKDILSAAVQSSSVVKPFIISITASTADELRPMIALIQAAAFNALLNTSCPNISSASPSGYIPSSIHPLLTALAEAHTQDKTLTIGLKLPPYTFRGQFDAMVNVLKECRVCRPDCSWRTCRRCFSTALSLGNVHTFHKLLHGDSQTDAGLRGICIIGVGGVTTPAALAHMRRAGASVVGAATLLGETRCWSF